jgi:hypothetical protein
MGQAFEEFKNAAMGFIEDAMKEAPKKSIDMFAKHWT